MGPLASTCASSPAGSTTRSTSNWFRVEWEGLENIPAEGGALLVANHAGAIPSDAPVIMHGIETELGGPSTAWPTTSSSTLPVVGTLWSRGGGVVAHPDNAYRLLREQQQLVLVFPEGTKGTGKPYTERYQLRRFGRGGFVEIAMRAGVPVIPIAVVGAEESMPILFKIGRPGQGRSASPYVPITANMLAARPARARRATSRPSSSSGCSTRSTSTSPPDQERYSPQPDHGRVRGRSASASRRRSTTCSAAPQSVWFG